jgi:hypothetical protein
MTEIEKPEGGPSDAALLHREVERTVDATLDEATQSGCFNLSCADHER